MKIIRWRWWHCMASTSILLMLVVRESSALTRDATLPRLESSQVLLWI